MEMDNLGHKILRLFNTLPNLNSPSRFAKLGDFQNKEYGFTISESRPRLAEKREEVDKEEEDHKQLQSVLRFRQTQQTEFIIAFSKLNSRTFCRFSQDMIISSSFECREKIAYDSIKSFFAFEILY